MTDQNYIVYAATYATIDTAKADFSLVTDMMGSGDVRKLTAALVSKDSGGDVHVHEVTQQGRAGGAIGVIAGLVLGAIFPPAGLAVLGGAIAGGVTLGVLGGAIGHLAGAASHKDLREMGEALGAGEAAIVAVAVNAIAQDIDAALSRAAKKATKQVSKGDLDAAVTELEKGLAKADHVLENA